MNTVIGFIGLGIMGKPMATHLLDAGFTLQVHDINPTPVEILAKKGALVANSPADVATKSQIIITMLPDSPDVETVVFGNKGLNESIVEGCIYIDMSTIAPSKAVEIAEKLSVKGVRCLDAPVSGGEIGAINAALSIMVGGEKLLFDEVLPVFNLLGETITHCGSNGAGQIVKACNQIQVALNIAGLCEALILSSKAGVDPAITLKVLSGGYAQNRVMDVRGPKIIRGDFKPGFKSSFHLKDLNIILQSGNDFDVPLPITKSVQNLFQQLIDEGGGDLDHTGLITLLEKIANFEARTNLK